MINYVSKEIKAEDGSQHKGDMEELTVTRSLLREFAVFSLGPQFRAAVKRVLNKRMPISITCPLHPTLHALAFGLEPRTLATTEEIAAVLGEGFLRKNFRRGSYAVTSPPLVLSYSDNKTKVTFSYHVYSKAGIAQAPPEVDEHDQENDGDLRLI